MGRCKGVRGVRGVRAVRGVRGVRGVRAARAVRGVRRVRTARAATVRQKDHAETNSAKSGAENEFARRSLNTNYKGSQ